MVLLREVAGVGPRLFCRLLKRFGSVEGILKADTVDLFSIERIGERTVRSIFKARSLGSVADRIIESARARDVSIITLFDRDYPNLLKNIPDPPPLIYVQGQILARDCFCVAVVGSHNATREGCERSRGLGRLLADHGFTIVSGLARGIDGEAHRGAIEKDGRTIAAIGAGLTHIIPRFHRKLATEIIKNGAVISEYPMDARPDKGKLLSRNRLITGLSGAVVIIEAPKKEAGTMNAFERALEQGRPVFVQRWPKDSPNYKMFRRIADGGGEPVDVIADVDRIIKIAAGDT